MAAQIIQVVARLALHTLHILLRNRYAHTPQPGLGFAQAADEAQLLRVLGGAVLGFEFAQEVVGYCGDGGHGLSPSLAGHSLSAVTQYPAALVSILRSRRS